MRWTTYRSPGDGQEHPGLLVDGALHGLRTAERLLDLLGDDGERLARAAEEARADPLDVLPEADADLLAPIPVPPSVRDFYAFETHVRTYREANGREMDPDWYELPVFYFQNPAAVRSARDDVPMPPGSVKYDYELEFAAVIGREGANLTPDEAEQHIAGYLLFCDWSARDLQAREVLHTLGPVKGKDIDLEMTASVNGRPYSKGNADDLYWSFGQMISYASRGTRVQTGDVIASGTVGTGCILELSTVHSEEEYPWLTPGDEVRLEADLLGAITARITPAPPLHALK
jgi:2-keto-4-pentenoate hydratase/2-oxohepta-3-ene-1,7-dioic acid hydratase in catechol pathway